MRAINVRPTVWRQYSSVLGLQGDRVARRLLTISTEPSQHRLVKTAGPRIIFSGIQPTGVPHLGNYLGALQQWVKLQDEADTQTRLFFSVVDLHALTLPQDPSALAESRRKTLAILLAIGLDPARSTIFYQSAVPQHAELMWLLSCRASAGVLSRMTQWKSKLSLSEDVGALDEAAKEKLKLGLFSYPVLQAADILVYKATHVPVGDDQSQHLEFARTLAMSFNSDYGKVLVPPRTLIAPAKRVMALNHPTAKMSKSDPLPRSRINLDDSEEEVARKIQHAVTDSTYEVTYQPESRPGVANLIQLAFHLDTTAASKVDDYAKDLEGQTLKALKAHVTQLVNKAIQPIGERYREILGMHGGSAVETASHEGASAARHAAESTMVQVRRSMGLA